MPVSDTEANAVLNAILNKAAYSVKTLHVALSTTTPTKAGANITEPSGNGYARVATDAADWAAAASRGSSNAEILQFPQASGGSWGTPTHFVIFDALTGGNMVAFGAIATPVEIPDGETARYPIGALTWSIP